MYCASCNSYQYKIDEIIADDPIKQTTLDMQLTDSTQLYSFYINKKESSFHLINADTKLTEYIIYDYSGYFMTAVVIIVILCFIIVCLLLAL